jgi:hypothetical protein
MGRQPAERPEDAQDGGSPCRLGGAEADLPFETFRS